MSLCHMLENAYDNTSGGTGGVIEHRSTQNCKRESNTRHVDKSVLRFERHTAVQTITHGTRFPNVVEKCVFYCFQTDAVHEIVVKLARGKVKTFIYFI